MSYKKLTTLVILQTLFAISFAAAAPQRAGVVGDYDGDGRADIVTATPKDNGWYWNIRLATGEEKDPFLFGLAPTGGTADTLVAADYDGNGKFQAGVAGTRGSDGLLYWFFRRTGGDTAGNVIQWGLPGDLPLTGYFGNPDKKDSLAVVRENGAGLDWYIRRNVSGNNVAAVQWGLKGDDVFTADIDGDGKDEIVVAQKVNGAIVWYARKYNNAQFTAVSWGLSTDVPHQPADFNGDGRADLVVSRDAGGLKTFYIRYDDQYAQAIPFGLSSDEPYIGQFTGEFAELALKRASSTEISHFVRFATLPLTVEVPFGLATDTVVQPNGRELAAASSDDDGDTDGGETPIGGGDVASCSQVLSVQSSNFIYKQSAPLRSGGVGTPLVGYRKEPTLIMNVNISSRGNIPILDSDGNVITNCPWATAHGHAGGRARCTAQTSTVRRAALSRTGSPTILFKINSSQCVSVPDAGRCYGSVKGLCNQLIQ